MKRIPFKIDRNKPETIPEQLANGFRQAIVEGYYKPGERLPTFGNIVRELGVSIRAPRDAMRILAQAHLVRPRPRIGCTVLAQNERIWKGRVLGVFLAVLEGSYYVSTMIGALRRTMIEHGYRFVPVAIDRLENGELDYSHFDALAAEKTDFILLIHPGDETATHVAALHIPSLAYVDVQQAPGIEKVVIERGKGLEDEVARLKAAGVKNVMVAAYDEKPDVRTLRRRGFTVESMSVSAQRDAGYLETVKRIAMEKMLKRLDSKKPLPDLIYFHDDVVAFGGFLALALRGIRIPQDVRVITMANRGFAPLWKESVARFEVDPQHDGRLLAAQIVDRIEGRPLSGICSPMRFVNGKTFDLECEM